MNDDDLFQQLFELFNQPGSVNWRLAAELNRHLAGERQPIEPWVAEEYRDLARLAEARLGEVSRLPVPSIADVVPIDPRGWAERTLSGFNYLGEALAGSFDLGEEGAGPLAPMLRPLGSSLVGMQLGTMVASLGKRVLASFEAGLPVEGPMIVVVPNVEGFASDTGLDLRQVRLWAVTSEIAHLTVWRVGWLRDHLASLIAEAGRAARVDLSSMFERFHGFGDPSALQQMAEGEGLADLLDQTASEPARATVDCLLSVTSGYARRLVALAMGQLLPALERIIGAFDDRKREPIQQPALVSLGPGDAAAGAGFFAEVERRFGPAASDRVWESPENLPTPAELPDPVGWAARVLLEGL